MSKGQYIGVSGVARKVKASYIGVNGVARKIKTGYVGVGGVARKFYPGGTGLSSVGVGGVVQVLESGMLQPYVIVQIGNPNTGIYDASCNGIWLMRKEAVTASNEDTIRYKGLPFSHTTAYSVRLHVSSDDYYSTEDKYYASYGVESAAGADRYLNEVFWKRFSASVQNKMLMVKIPYTYEIVTREQRPNGETLSIYNLVYAGASRLARRLFIPSAFEIGYANSVAIYPGHPTIGSRLAYFSSDMSLRRAVFQPVAQSVLRGPIDMIPRKTYAEPTWNADGGITNTIVQTNGGYGIHPIFVVPLNCLAKELMV